MFLENTINHAKQSGWMEVICGSMFSGKTEELIRRLRRAEMAGQQVEIFKPKLDNRYADEEVVSHNQNKIKSTPVETPDEILLLGSNCDVVGIDEAQFFDESIVEIANQLANNGAQSDGHGRICYESPCHLQENRELGELFHENLRE